MADDGTPASVASAASHTSQASESRVGGTLINPKGNFDPTIPAILPHEQMYAIQVGDQRFTLSGASLSSDGPSYFTTFFLRHKDKPPVLFLDRSPDIFKLIVRHLQGYYIMPSDEATSVYLLIDARYYQLPRLTQQLLSSELMIRIGNESIKVPRNAFDTPGDEQNFFTAGMGVFFGLEHDTTDEIHSQFIRPPPLAIPTVPKRDGNLFKQLLSIQLGGYVDILSDEHRDALVRECRYFRFRGLEQKLIKHSIRVDPLRKRKEISLYLKNVDLKKIEFINGSLTYKRPFIDNESMDLVFQVPDEAVLSLSQSRVSFYGASKLKLDKLAKLHDLKFGSVDLNSAHLEISGSEAAVQHQKRANSDTHTFLTKSVWRFQDGGKGALVLLKAEGYNTEGEFNKQRGFF